MPWESGRAIAGRGLLTDGGMFNDGLDHDNFTPSLHWLIAESALL